MPDGTTGSQPKRIRIPPKLVTLTHQINALLRQSNLANDWLRADYNEARELATVRKREQKIKQKYSNKKRNIEAKRDRLAAKVYEHATENRDTLTQKSSPNTAALPTGHRFLWRIRKVTDLPENDKLPTDKEKLEAFYAEADEKGLTGKYVRIKKEPNRSALNDAANAAEVATLRTVSLVNRRRFTIDLKDVPLNITGVIENDDTVHDWEYVVPENRSKRK